MKRRSQTVVALVILAAVAALGVSPTRASARSMQRAFAGATSATVPLTDQVGVFHEISAKLGATMVRYDVKWPLAEPARGQFDDTGYLASVVAGVQAARAEGLKVVVTVVYCPRWASDRSFWDNPPSDDYSGYQVFYPIDPGALDDWQAFMQHLATLLKGNVLGYECWNEPNLWPYIYPQFTIDDPYFAVHKYLSMLKRFTAGVRAADPKALIIAGSTSPGGGSMTRTMYRTSPQLFAQLLKQAGAGAYFDAYSHHPYVLGGVGSMDPRHLPLNPDTTVGLSNLSVLLKLFPKKPFYLTEYGFNTQDSNGFGLGISETQQARYLKEAYRMAARHPQLKALFWYLLRDASPSGKPTDPRGVYTGLRRIGGAAKPAWYAFAGGNRLGLDAPSTSRRGATIRLRGRLSCATVGGVSGKALLLRGRGASGAWTTLRTVTTGTNGTYSVKVVLRSSTRYRIVWKGVVSSAIRLVRAR